MVPAHSIKNLSTENLLDFLDSSCYNRYRN
nr:MAG TPA: hypothetical protein [Caudoviricetes sp.]